MNNEQQRDQDLWEMAKARVTFRWTLLAYVISNTMIIAVWYFYSDNRPFWPIWPILGWGIALAFQYYNAYHGNCEISTRKEYEKLKRTDSQS
jgi:hypothetical protein